MKRKSSSSVEITPSNIFAALATVFVAIFALVVIFSAAYTLNEDEDAVIATFGTPSVVEDSGLHFKIPFVQTLEKVDMSVRSLPIGYDPVTNATIENESLMITNDFNFVSVDFYVEWQVTDAVAYTYAAKDPQQILKTLAMSYIRDTIGSYSIDEVLTTGKAQIQSEIKEKLVSRLEKEGIGITVRGVAIQDAEPPTSAVSNAFKAVEDAKQQAEKTINEANAYRNQQIPSAEARVNAILESAEAEKQARISEANGQIARFTAMYEEYMKFPEITKARMYYEAMEELLPNLKVIIQDGDGTIVTILGENDKAG
jgi:membrane protease subunit HflK